jgi:hypothetical protein
LNNANEPAAACRAMARSSAAASTRKPITTSGQVGGDSLNGKIGNGACTLSLTNSNGNIEILKLAK